MKVTEFMKGGEKLGYTLSEDGYDIYFGDKLTLSQHEPYIPYPSLGYEGSCLKQIEEMCSEPEAAPDTMEQRLSALEEENAMLSSTLDDILTNVIPTITGESEVN